MPEKNLEEIVVENALQTKIVLILQADCVVKAMLLRKNVLKSFGSR